MASSDPITTFPTASISSTTAPLPGAELSARSAPTPAASPWALWLNQVHPVWMAAVVFGLIALGGYGKSRNYAVLNFKAADMILEDRAIRFLDWAHLSYIFTSVQQLGYAPIPRLSFALDWVLWGTDPAGYRGTNFLLFWFGVTLVFLFFYEVTASQFTAWAIALCFALHPAQIESVVWLAGRKDVLAIVFGMASLWMYRRAVVEVETLQPIVTTYQWPRWVWYGGSLILFGLALLTKIQWAGLGLVIIALDIYERRLNSWRVLPRYIPFLALGGFLFGITLKIQIAQVGKPPLIDIVAVCERIDRFVLTLWHLVWPVNLVPVEPDPAMSTWFSILGLGILALILAEASSSLRKGRREIFFASIWLLMFLLPWASFAGISNIAIDRVLSLVLLSLLFPLALGLTRLPRKVAFPVVSSVILVLAISTFRTISVWESDLSVWRAVTAKYPNEVFALACLAYAETEAGNLQEAQKAYQRGIKITESLSTIYPPLYGAGSNLAAKLGTEPFEPLQLGFKDAPYQPQLLIYAGQLEIAKGKWNRAEYFFLLADRINPSTRLAGTLAEIYVGLNKPEKGLGYIEKALARDPFREDYWLTRGKLLEANGQVEGAKSAYRRSIALAPELIESRFGLAQLVFRQQKYAEIESILHKDNELYPNLVLSASALNLLAAAYQNQGKPLLALATMTQVVQKEDNPV
ncbi:MAG TPA: hypothetical protein PKE58_19645, partial [Acidobacteriota bacterium]|nr:hypothetical protein [Acidobacteriota bacterium]